MLPVRRQAEEQEQVLTRMDWALLGAGAALRFFDYKTTVKMVSDPVNFREIELPQGLVHNRPALGAFEAGTVVANYFAYRFVIERGHRKLARFGQAIYVGGVAGAVGWNDYELIQYWPRRSLPIR